MTDTRQLNTFRKCTAARLSVRNTHTFYCTVCTYALRTTRWRIFWTTILKAKNSKIAEVLGVLTWSSLLWVQCLAVCMFFDLRGACEGVLHPNDKSGALTSPADSVGSIGLVSSWPVAVVLQVFIHVACIMYMMDHGCIVFPTWHYMKYIKLHHPVEITVNMYYLLDYVVLIWSWKIFLQNSGITTCALLDCSLRSTHKLFTYNTNCSAVRPSKIVTINQKIKIVLPLPCQRPFPTITELSACTVTTTSLSQWRYYISASGVHSNIKPTSLGSKLLLQSRHQLDVGNSPQVGTTYLVASGSLVETWVLMLDWPAWSVRSFYGSWPSFWNYCCCCCHYCCYTFCVLKVTWSLFCTPRLSLCS